MLRAAGVGLALGITIACGGASAFQSVNIVKELVLKGQPLLAEADEKLKQNRPDAAYIIIRRHIHDVDAEIAKVEKDQLINAGDKTKTVQLLKGYRGELQRSADQARRIMTFESDIQTSIRGNPRF